MGNVLESVTIREHPEIAKLKQLMNEAGSIGSLMSGSGPTVFGLFVSEEDIQRAFDSIRGTGFSGDLFMTDFYAPA